MKRTLLLIIFILSFVNAIDAQRKPWYESCGVIDINNTTSEEFECLWKIASKNVLGGAITTGIGTSFLVIGLVHLASSGYDALGIGLLIVTGGIITDIIGISVGITGVVRKSQLRKTPNYDTLNLGSLNLSPVIGLNQFNGTHYLGMSLSLSF